MAPVRRSHKLIFVGLFFIFLALWPQANMPRAAGFPLDFTTFKLGNSPKAVLVVGGIQGDEPGGFSAATLLAMRYEVHKGALWVVPNLNFPSIIRRSRGLHGDMNRKFADLDEKDPEFGTVRRIQDLISHPDVHLVLNLHDGSGYYRPIHEDNLRNPRRWGQSIIIDQSTLAGVFMGVLEEEAASVAKAVNSCLIDKAHALHVHNTNTAAGDREMEKSLSYYAVKKNKAAFGLEASKEFPVALRTFYHLSMIEEFLKLAGVEFSRDFELTPAGVETALVENLGVSFAENRIFLPLEDARPTINHLPMPHNGISKAITSKPIMAVLPCGKTDGELCIHYGNRKITLIKPEWREIDDGIDAMKVLVDGEEKLAPFGQIVDVGEQAVVQGIPGFRVNAIGFDLGRKDESGIALRHKDFEPRFSVDRAGRIFRVEVYRGKNFAGMFLLRFQKKTGKMTAGKKSINLPAIRGRESTLGF